MHKEKFERLGNRISFLFLQGDNFPSEEGSCLFSEERRNMNGFNFIKKESGHSPPN